MDLVLNNLQKLNAMKPYKPTNHLTVQKKKKSKQNES